VRGQPCKVLPFRSPVLRRQVVESVRRVGHRPHVEGPEDYQERRERDLWRAGVVVLACLVAGLLLICGAAVIAAVGR